MNAFLASPKKDSLLSLLSTRSMIRTGKMSLDKVAS